ncbi:MAG: hypothetical protein ACR2RE_26335, partial [Geminicoccaceae bacterium]
NGGGIDDGKRASHSIGWSPARPSKGRNQPAPFFALVIRGRWSSSAARMGDQVLAGLSSPIDCCRIIACLN